MQNHATFLKGMTRMKKLLFLGALVGLLFAFQPAEQVIAGDNDSQFCAMNGDFGFESHGACVSAVRTSPVRLCQWIKDQGYFPDVYGYDPEAGEVIQIKNQGQCVKYFR